MNQFSLSPCEDRIVVEPAEPEAVTPGGIVLPDAAQKKSERGTVIAVGPGRWLDSGNRQPMPVMPGDQILYERYAGSDIEIDQREVKIIRLGEVMARVDV